MKENTALAPSNVGAKLHAKYSASGAERWLNCPGSIRQCEGIPPPPSSPHAERGTIAHALLESLLLDEPEPKEVTAYGLTPEDREAVREAVQYIRGVQHECHTEDTEFLVEVRVDLPVSEPGQFGTVDVAIAEPFGTLHVMDYKHGAGVLVEVNDNPQLAYYALGLAAKYDFNFGEIKFHVVQPRAISATGESIRTKTFSVQDLKQWREKFEAGIKRTKAKNAELVPGEKWCRFCPAAVSCPALYDRQVKALEGEFEKVLPTALPPAEIGRRLAILEKLSSYHTQLFDYAFKLAEAGVEIPGYALVEKRGTRKWTNIEEATIRAREFFGDLAFSQPELLSPAQLEKVMGKLGLEFTAEFASTVISGTKLVRSSESASSVSEFTKVSSDAEILPKEDEDMKKKAAAKKPAPKKKGPKA